MVRPCIDHSGLSPSGRVSKRAREAWEKRELARLFDGMGDLRGEGPPQPTERERDLRQAQQLEALADRGMCPRKYRRMADELRAKHA